MLSMIQFLLEAWSEAECLMKWLVTKQDTARHSKVFLRDILVNKKEPIRCTPDRFNLFMGLYEAFDSFCETITVALKIKSTIGICFNTEEISICLNVAIFTCSVFALELEVCYVIIVIYL